MPLVYTIGYTKKSLKEFMHLLTDAEVDAVIDVRLRNTSQLAGFSKRDDLAFLLHEGFRIGYQHRPDLAPSPEILDSFKENGNWGAYEQAFNRDLAENALQEVGRELLARFERPCLLCAEPLPDHCHR
ncbi:DUF488 family protein, partial [Chloroflexota bacterium]